MKSYNIDTSELYKANILINSLFIKDFYTMRHSIIVANMMAIAQKKYIKFDTSTTICYLSGLLHDIGKMYMPQKFFSNYIVNGAADWKEIKKHPQLSSAVLKKLQFNPLICKVVEQHHERVNGSGYPRGLKGSEIKDVAKLLAIIDTLAAMTDKNRTYSKNKDVCEAILVLIEEKNKGLYDNKLTDAVVNHIDLIFSEAESITEQQLVHIKEAI